MTRRERWMAWVGIVLLAVLFLYFVSPVLLPFVLGAAIAYFLDPVADRLQRLGLSRVMATVLILLCATLVFIMLAVLLLPPLIQQSADFMVKIPDYLRDLRELAQQQGQKWFGDFATRNPERFDEALTQITQKGAAFAGQVFSSLLSGGLAFFNLIALFLVTPVVAFYLLRDWDRMVEQIDNWLPRSEAPVIRRLAGEMNEVISGFVRGQFTVLLILATFYMIGLTLIGLNFGLLIGLAAGLISFIPYIGPIVGFVLGGAVALVQFWPDWISIAAVIGVFFLGQFLEG
ncbi:MAG: AI-2E family transporter, partial [Hyphomicrobiales bacterium]